jgi:hypothetical protein
MDRFDNRCGRRAGGHHPAEHVIEAGSDPSVAAAEHIEPS